MRLLLDTHAFLWWCFDNPNLKPSAKRAIAAPDTIVFVSAVSIWEISIKAAQQRLSAPESASDAIISNGFLCLPVDCRHGEAAGKLPPHHNDPFDRMLIAQAKLEELTIITRDRKFSLYGVPLLPA